MTFRSIIRPLTVEMISGGRPMIAADIVKEAQIRYPEEFAEATERLAFNAATREVKDVLKSLTDDDDSPQLALPGLSLPSVIAIPVEGDFVYRATAGCTWDELKAGEGTREANVAAALSKLDSYREGLDALQPIMEGTHLTAIEAAKRLGGES